MQEYILLIGANQYLRERSLAGARRVSDLPIWNAGVDIRMCYNRHFDNCIEADPQESESLLKAIWTQKQKGWTPKGIIPLNDWTLKAANEANQALGLRHLSSESVGKARNKFEMKEAFVAHGVRTAPYHLIENEGELPSAAKDIGFPAIIKPFDFGGSGGVYLARNMEELYRFFRKAQEMMEQYAKQFHIDGNRYLIEHYIDSREEISIEVLCFNDRYETLTLTEKYLSPEPWFAEMAHLVPSHRLHDPHLNALAHKACQALGIKLGMAHVEVKLRDGKAWVIEAAARPGGDGIMDQIERSYGINPYALHVSAYLGQDPFPLMENIRPRQTAAIAFLKAKSGRIVQVNSPESLDEVVHSLSIQAEVGKISEDPSCWKAREGVVEFTWPELFQKKTDQPIRLANALSDQIFQVEKNL